ncbi:MAG: tryptophan synthase subunit alpha [Pyrinomonadaceae bacterium]
MSRIAAAFSKLKVDGRKGFIPFITAGDPDLETTRALLVELAHAGATVIEVGVPFSDPMADGPTIQRASERALRHGFGIKEILQTIAAAQSEQPVPTVLFSYYNPLLRYGIERLARDAQAAGVDGVLVTDLIPEEATEFTAALRAHDLDTIFLVAPTSTDLRLQLIAERASGFIYAVARAGVTGARAEMTRDAETLAERMRKYSNLPIAVGFGISTHDQVADVWRYADAAIVGSAIVTEIEKSTNKRDAITRVGTLVRNFLDPQ